MKRVAVGIITKEIDGQKQYLLISATKDFGEFTGFYYPSGGHMEEGETEQQTIVREIKEELGLDVKIGERIAETSGDIKDQVTYWWFCEVIGGELTVQKEEIVNVKWFTEEEIKNEVKIWPATKNIFLNYIFKN
jgi:8-oxo-dGTP pyrophosphatase MutT (NUDIX family)